MTCPLPTVVVIVNVKASIDAACVVLNSVCAPKDTVEYDDSDASNIEPCVLVENEIFGTLNLTYLGLLWKKVCLTCFERSIIR